MKPWTVTRARGFTVNGETVQPGRVAHGSTVNRETVEPGRVAHGSTVNGKTVKPWNPDHGSLLRNQPGNRKTVEPGPGS